MKWTFRKLLILFAMVLSLASTAGLSSFFLSLYRTEKIANLFNAEQGNVKRIASHLDNLIQLVNLIDIQKVEESREIAFVTEDPCQPNIQARVGLSRYFAKHFHDLELDPLQWSNSLEVFKSCEELRAPASASSTSASVAIVPSTTQIFVPYILVLVPNAMGGHRLGMISLDGFRTTTANTLFLTRKDGRPFWSADGTAYLTQALFDTGVPPSVLETAARMAIENGDSRAAWAGQDGLLAYAPTQQQLAIMSLSYAPAILAPVRFVQLQVLLLASGFFFLCFFFGKKMAEFIALPLQRLQTSAERIGKGDFSARVEARGLQEFIAVSEAFNVMSAQIRTLIEKARESVAIEKELVVAQQVQKLLIPPAQSDVAGHLIHGSMKAAQHVGGDWWGYIEIARDGASPLLLLLVGDATDHGVPPALIAATVKGAQSILSIILSSGKLSPNPGEILGWLNKTVHDAAKGSITMSLVAAVFDLDQRQVTVANAGHVHPYLITSQGVKVISGGGRVLGENAVFEHDGVKVMPWNPTDRLFFYTDGLIDLGSAQGKTFDRKTLSRFLRDLPPTTRGREIWTRVLKQREKVAEGTPQVDDMTVVVCEAKGVGP